MDLINRMQNQLNNNWAVEARDIQALINQNRRLMKTLLLTIALSAIALVATAQNQLSINTGQDFFSVSTEYNLYDVASPIMEAYTTPESGSGVGIGVKAHPVLITEDLFGFLDVRPYAQIIKRSNRKNISTYTEIGLRLDTFDNIKVDISTRANISILISIH